MKSDTKNLQFFLCDNFVQRFKNEEKVNTEHKRKL